MTIVEEKGGLDGCELTGGDVIKHKTRLVYVMYKEINQSTDYLLTFIYYG